VSSLSSALNGCSRSVSYWVLLPDPERFSQGELPQPNPVVMSLMLGTATTHVPNEPENPHSTSRNSGESTQLGGIWHYRTL
jgi:hypothetical protein